MGVFSRFKDIVTANISTMLDKAEDPEKMIRLMIREMEETLVELKASCAGTMASCSKIQRDLETVTEKQDLWEERARLAMERGREDLAREALTEKLRWTERGQALEEESIACTTLVEQARTDISQLEEKIQAAKEKQRILVQRQKRAQAKYRAQTDIRRAQGADAIIRFEKMEQRIEQMEAEANIVSPSRPKKQDDRSMTLEEEFELLEGNSDIDEELERLKARHTKKD